jgi:hypothetical protein
MTVDTNSKVLNNLHKYNIYNEYAISVLPLFKYLNFNDINKTTSKIFSYYHNTIWSNDNDMIEWFLYTEKNAIKELLLYFYKTILDTVQIPGQIQFANENKSTIYQTTENSYNNQLNVYLPFSKEEERVLYESIAGLIECIKSILQHMKHAFDVVIKVYGYLAGIKLNYKTLIHQYKHKDASGNQVVRSTKEFNNTSPVNYDYILNTLLGLVDRTMNVFYQDTDKYSYNEVLNIYQLLALIYQLISYALPISSNFTDEYCHNHDSKPDKTFLRSGVNIPLINVLGIPINVLNKLNLKDVESGQGHDFDYHSYVYYLQKKQHMLKMGYTTLDII